MENKDIRFVNGYGGMMVKFCQDCIVIAFRDWKDTNKATQIPYEFISKIKFSSWSGLQIATKDNWKTAIYIQEKKKIKRVLDSIISKINKPTSKKRNYVELTADDKKFIEIATKIKQNKQVSEQERILFQDSVDEQFDTTTKGKFKNRAIIFVLIAIALILCFIFPVPALVILTCIATLAAMIKQQNIISYNDVTKTLTLHKKTVLARKFILIRRYYKPSSRFVPTQLTYSGMTVGGVSVGSAEINEAHYEASATWTDKFMLCYKKSNRRIEKIVCGFKIPQNSAVAKFCVDENTIVLKPRNAKTQLNSFDVAFINNSSEAASYNYIGNMLEDQQLEHSDCKLIKSWIIGKIE